MAEEKVLKIKRKAVSQNSRLGSLGLLCLFEAGFAGLPYHLKNRSIDFYQIADNIGINFYNRNTTINSKNKYYNEIKDCLIKKE